MKNTEIKWSVSKLISRNDEVMGDVVEKVRYTATATATAIVPPHPEAPDGAEPMQTTIVAEIPGTVRLPEPDGEFTPYDQLSEEQVLEWVFGSLTEAQKTAIETDLANEIEAKSRPPQPTPPAPLPWET